jgi:hypothetical protein
MKTTTLVSILLILTVCPAEAEEYKTLPYLSSGVIDTTDIETLGLTMTEDTQTVTIFTPSEESNHYANGVVMTAFKGWLYCMWQSSETDEDAIETCVMYSQSCDEGLTWSQPAVLAAANDRCYCTSGGWISTEDTLTAFINVWPKDLQPVGGYTYYIISKDGIAWSAPEPVRMADGQSMSGVIEQDPYPMPDGRIIGAVHFQPGLHVCPVYTDDKTGVSGWTKAVFKGHDREKQSRELEPSIYQRQDGTLVMVFRDQNSTYRKMTSLSDDRGETWTESVVTNIPDARVKQSAGNLPDGTAYLVGCPTGSKRRYPLVALFSDDGICFDKALLLRAGGSDLQSQRYPGKAKTLGYSYPKSMIYNDKLYISYSTNKEDVECTIWSFK